MHRNAYGFSVESELGVDEAEANVRELLKEQGFAVLTEIDVRTTLKEKLNVDFREYRILGTCNPSLANQALEAEPLIGLLLPCNVVVEARPEGGSQVSFLDPLVALGMVGNPKLQPVAVDAAARLMLVADSIERPRTPETNHFQRR
ncbi:MAG TPA: DUF302 domain-containing protein [Candidatus Dormibacteraeota bacterium]